MQAAGMPGGHNPVVMQSGVTDKQRKEESRRNDV